MLLPEAAAKLQTSADKDKHSAKMAFASAMVPVLRNPFGIEHHITFSVRFIPTSSFRIPQKSFS
jgi:hypothetical protein